MWFRTALGNSTRHHLHLVLAENSLFDRLASRGDWRFRSYLLARIESGLRR